MLRWLARTTGSRAGILGAGCLLCAGVGCTTTWDDITSQRFRNDPMKTMFGPDDPPMVVLREDRTGDERIRAMRKLTEPARSGAGDEAQTEAIQILTKIATNDPHILCRLTAVETLGRFQDPRATESLMAAYRASESASSGSGIGSYAPDNVALLQSRSIALIGEKRDPRLLPFLVEVANRPQPKVQADAAVVGLSGQNMQDVRLAAVQAIGNYPASERQAAVTLAKVMTQEQTDVAIRVQAHQGLVKMTGRDLPIGAPEWNELVQVGATEPDSPAPAPRIQQVGGSRPQ